MRLVLTDADRAALAAATHAEPRARRWRRYRAIALLGEGQSVPTLAHALECSVRRVRGWLAAWRRDGVDGLVEGVRSGGPRKRDHAGEQWLMALLATDPQRRGQHMTGWTVPVLRGELARAGYALSETTLRRALHRLGYHGKRPRYVLGRPDPAYAQKKMPCVRRSRP